MAIHNSLRVSALSTAGLLFGTALLPAGSAFAAAAECGTDATLVADGICEVTFTETPNSAWTPPAGITKLQALLVGAGGAAGGPANWNGYGGGSGDVQLVELATTGNVSVTVGAAQPYEQDSADSNTVVEQGSDTFTAEGGMSPYDVNGIPWGGTAGNGNLSAEWGQGGGGVGGSAGFGAYNSASGGPGFIVNEIDPATFDLFANDDECLGAGGSSIWYWTSGSDVFANNRAVDCNRNILPAGKELVVDPNSSSRYVFANEAPNLTDFVGGDEPIANTGTGGSAWGRNDVNGGSFNYQLGADGKVVLRYDVALAATGFDATGSLIAGAALVTAGAVVATRRRRA